MHHDDTAPTTPHSPKTAPRSPQTASKAVRSTKTAKNASEGPKRVSPVKKKAVPKRKSPHLIKKDAQRVAARKAAEREEMMTEGEAVPQGKTILLSEMAEFLNDYFSKQELLNDFTPYDWWKRHKKGTISTPMPNPVRMVGSGPLFRATDIVKWYKVYVANKGRWDTGA